MLELERKIRQMHAALEGLATGDLSNIEPRVTSSDTHVFAIVDFNENSDPIALYNAVSLLVANIASLKDHLKVWCKRHGVPFHGDALINGNKAVALVHDLWNTDKHAELNSPPRSGHKPSLKDVRTALRISTGMTAGSGAFFSMDPRTGKLTTGTTGGGKVELALVAQIVDEAGAVLGDFTQTCEEAVEAWSNTLTAAGVQIP